MKKFFLFLTLLTLSVGQMWGAEVTIASWSAASRTANNSVSPTSSQTDNTSARLKSECALSTAGSGGAAGSYYGTWTNDKCIYITGLNLSGYTGISLTISNFRRTSASTANFYASTNGSTYSSTTFTTKNVGTSNASCTVSSIASNVQAIKIKISGGSGNLWLGSVTIKGTAAPSCTSLTMSTVTATPGNTRIDLSWPTVANASSYTVTCKRKSDNSTAGISIGSVSGSGPKTCAITGLTNGTEYTWSVMPVGTGSYCAENTPATGDATPNQTRTITYYDKDGSHTTTLADGTNIATALNALYGASSPTSCNTTNYNYFVGWKDGEISGTATSVTLLSTEVVNATTAAKTYYAVWSDTDPSAAGGWEVATSITVGDVVMLGYNASKQLSGISTTSTKYGLVANFPSGDADAAYPLTVCAGSSNGTFAFKNSNNSYLYWGSGNSLNVNATLNANTSWTFTYSAGTTTLANASDNTRKIKYNSNDTRFAAYTSAQNDISLYKRVSVSANYITTCCTELGSINGSFFWPTLFSYLTC